MKNWLIGAILLSCFLLDLGAQNVVISDVVDLEPEGHYEIIGEYEGRILLYRDNEGEIDILAFNKDMQRLWSKPLEVAYDRVRTAGIIARDTSFEVYLNYLHRDSNLIYKYTFDRYADLLEEGKRIFETTEWRGRLFFGSSLDATKAVFFQLIDNRNVQVMSFDAGLDQWNWHHTIELEDNLREEFLALEVTNSGEAFMVLDRENQRFDRHDHHFEILHFQPNVNEVLSYEIPFADYLTQSAQTVYDEVNKELNVTGYYTERNQNRAEGVFYFSFAPEHASTEVVRHKWGNDIKESIYGPQGANAEGIDFLNLKKLIPREDGGVLLIGEVEKIYERRSSYGERSLYNGGSNWIDFIFEDLVLVSIHPDGDWHWSKVLHKRQFSQDDNAIYSSFFTFNLPSFIRIVYNDEISNSSTASAYEVFTDGSYSRTSILSTQYQKLQLRFQEAYQYSSTAMVVPSEFKGKLKLVHIQF